MWQFYNDVSMLGDYVYAAVMYLFVLLLCGVMHEMGHLAYFWMVLGHRVKLHVKWRNIWNFGFEVGQITDYAGLSDRQYRSLIFWGVFAGMIPIILLSFSSIIVLLMIIPYMAASWYDVAILFQDVKLDDVM